MRMDGVRCERVRCKVGEDVKEGGRERGHYVVPRRQHQCENDAVDEGRAHPNASVLPWKRSSMKARWGLESKYLQIEGVRVAPGPRSGLSRSQRRLGCYNIEGGYFYTLGLFYHI